MLLLALAALGLNGKCGSYSSDPVPITHPLYKPSVRDVYDVYNSIAFTTNIPEESWLTVTAARALSCSARPYRQMLMLMAARRQRRDGQACAAWPNPPAELPSFL